MTGQVATGAPDALLKRIISEKRQRLRKNVHILFLGLSAEEADPIITLLRGARLAPRGKQVQSAQEFNTALTERAWDLILSPQVEGKFTAKEALQILQRQNRDIPIIQLVTKSTSQSLLQGLKAKMATVISLEEQELLLIQIRRQLEHLENRRRLKQVEAQLAESETLCKQLADLSELPILYINTELEPIYTNKAFGDLFGLDDAHNLHGQGLDKFVSMKHRDNLRAALRQATDKLSDPVESEFSGRRVDGTNFQALFILQHARYMNQDCVQVIIRPDSKANEDSFENLDPITRLFDKEYMLSSLEKAVHKALPGGADCNLLYIKFDNFNNMQSELGSKGCDIVLSDIAELLHNKINKAHICARIGDGVFAVLFHDPNAEKALKLGELLCRAIAKQQIDVTGVTVQTTCSIGVATINDNAPHYLEILDRARHASDNVGSKDSHGNGVNLYELQQIEEEPEDNSAIQLIQDALKNDQFHILFQPIVGLASANGLGNYEVFLRLNDEESQEGVSPNVFLTTLDHSETSIKLDKWVIEKSFAQIAEQLNEQKRSRVFINLTARFIQNIEVLKWISDQFKKHRIPADLVAFQISESDLSTTLPQAEKFTAGLRKLGCKLCIKHYGLSEKHALLRQKLKPDLIKLDGTFIQELSNSADGDKTFAAILKPLKAAKVSTIAPMVEDTRLMGKLWKLGIDYVQGYYLQPPGPEMNYDFFE